MPKQKRVNRNYRETKSERSGNRGNATFGHWQRMEGYVRKLWGKKK